MLDAMLIFVVLPLAPVAIILTVEAIKAYLDHKRGLMVRRACIHPDNRKGL